MRRRVGSEWGWGGKLSGYFLRCTTNACIGGWNGRVCTGNLDGPNRSVWKCSEKLANCHQNKEGQIIVQCIEVEQGNFTGTNGPKALRLGSFMGGRWGEAGGGEKMNEFV